MFCPIYYVCLSISIIPLVSSWLSVNQPMHGACLTIFSLFSPTCLFVYPWSSRRLEFLYLSLSPFVCPSNPHLHGNLIVSLSIYLSPNAAIHLSIDIPHISLYLEIFHISGYPLIYWYLIYSSSTWFTAYLCQSSYLSASTPAYPSTNNLLYLVNRLSINPYTNRPPYHPTRLSTTYPIYSAYLPIVLSISQPIYLSTYQSSISTEHPYPFRRPPCTPCTLAMHCVPSLVTRMAGAAQCLPCFGGIGEDWRSRIIQWTQ